MLLLFTVIEIAVSAHFNFGPVILKYWHLLLDCSALKVVPGRLVQGLDSQFPIVNSLADKLFVAVINIKFFISWNQGVSNDRAMLITVIMGSQ